MQFLGNFGKIIWWRPPRGVGAPSLGKSWIRHWFHHVWVGTRSFTRKVRMLESKWNYIHVSVSEWFCGSRCFLHGYFEIKKGIEFTCHFFSNTVQYKSCNYLAGDKEDIHPFCFLSTMTQVTCGLIYGHFNWKLQLTQVDKWSPCR